MGMDIKLKIQSGYDRDAIVSALASSGYKVWITTKETGVMDKEYYVNFELTTSATAE
jgi:hypothetical protein